MKIKNSASIQQNNLCSQAATPAPFRVAVFFCLTGWLLWLYWVGLHWRTGLSGGVFGALVVLGVVSAVLRLGAQFYRRQAFIRQFAPQPAHWARVAQDLGPLTAAQQRLIEQGWRDYALMQLRLSPERRTRLWMPSQAVDALWHALILDTRQYGAFCQQAFGRLLHHVPAGAVDTGDLQVQRMRSWQRACRLAGLDPRQTATLPLLFAVDAQVGVAGAVRHDPVQWSREFAAWIAGARRSSDTDWDSSDGSDGGCSGGDGCGGGCGGD